jgi:predicted ATPase/DNA-binding CsgD family transcriptional regulator/DNA-binding XRE family transcriptional regulator
METSANMAKQEPAPFGALLLRLRAAAGLTQEQLAALAGLSPGAISALESGKRRTPRFATVELLAAALALNGQQRQELVAAARSWAIGATKAGPIEASPTVASAVPGAEDNGAALGTHRHPWRSFAEPTPLVDRVRELETIVRILDAGDSRLLTLTGPPGVGKTRIAQEAAARVITDGERFPDEGVFVDLTPVRDPALVLDSLATAVGLLDTSSRPVLERLVELLQERRQLLVIDNYEQVLPAASSLVDLLTACPGLALLVTSRVPLQLRWEQTLRVAPLPVPDLSGAPLPSLNALLAVPSVALFVSRARARQADFVLGDEEAPLVAQLVTQLDGLPLALELAAARLDVLPLSTLTRRLGDRLELLASQSPDLPERQRSLEAAVGWSYDLLIEPERRLFRCLGVFVGRVSLDAISAVVSKVRAPASAESDGEAPKVTEAGVVRRTLPQLLSLAEKSLLLPLPARPEAPNEMDTLNELLRRPGQHRANDRPTETIGIEEDGDDSEPAFAMLETVREYAWERLAADGELAAAQRAHAHYFQALAEQADPELRGSNQRAWHLRLEREHDNLRTALRWFLDQARPGGSNVAAAQEAGLRMAGALGYFWYVRGYHREGRSWLERMLALASQGEARIVVQSSARTRALIAAGPLLMVQAGYAQARVVLKEALALAERQQDPTAIAQASTYLGHVTVVAGDVDEGMRWLQEAVRHWKALGDPHGLGEALFYLGYAADIRGDLTAAAAHYTAALGHLGKAGNAQHAGFVQSYLGVAEWRRSKLSSAVKQIQAVLETSVTLRDRWLLSFAAQATVVLVGSRAQPAAWERLLGAADALAQATGGGTFGWEHLPGAEQVVGLREQLAREGGLSVAYREGRSLPFTKVAALALTLLGEVAQATAGRETDVQRQEAPQSSSQSRVPGSLSTREQEVLQLVAKGFSNKAIGRQLFISERTVAQHLTAIFNKLGVHTRAQAVAVATQRGRL